MQLLRSFNRFFDKMGMKSSPQNATNGAIMAVLWFIYRILFFGWLGAGLFRMRSDLMTLKAYQVRVRVCLRVASLKCAMIACRLTFRTCVHIMVCVCVCVSREETERKREREREGAFLSPLLYFATV